jgi:hypothetical protein
VGLRIFSTSTRQVLGVSTQRPIQRVLRALSPEVKWRERETDHSSPASAEVKENVDLYIHSSIRLHGIVFN